MQNRFYVLYLKLAVHILIGNGNVELSLVGVVGNTADVAGFFDYTEPIYAGSIEINCCKLGGEVEGMILSVDALGCNHIPLVSVKELKIEIKLIGIKPLTSLKRLLAFKGKIYGIDLSGCIFVDKVRRGKPILGYLTCKTGA